MSDVKNLFTLLYLDSSSTKISNVVIQKFKPNYKAVVIWITEYFSTILSRHPQVILGTFFIVNTT